MVSGGGMGHMATSGRAQVGASSCEASIWRSESAVVCYAGVGLGGRATCRKGVRLHYHTTCHTHTVCARGE